MTARSTCRKCGVWLAAPGDFLRGEHWPKDELCLLRAALRTERRVSRELRGLHLYLKDWECENAHFVEVDCNENELEFPCAPCAARRGLARARTARRSK